MDAVDEIRALRAEAVAQCTVIETLRARAAAAEALAASAAAEADSLRARTTAAYVE